MPGIRVRGTITFNTRQRRDAGISRCADNATQRGWTRTPTSTGNFIHIFDYSRTDAIEAYRLNSAETAYNFYHDNGMTDGSMLIEDIP